jgi:hypothetical protein
MRMVTSGGPRTERTACAFIDRNQGSASRAGISWCAAIRIRSIPMLDAVMLAIALAFFALSIAYVYACDHL